MDSVVPPYLVAAESLKKNPGQWDVYNSQKHCVALAGPGSGKTKTLTITIARLLSEDVLEPRGIACITYNSECARELRRRFERLGISLAPNLVVGTLHSFCLKHLVVPFGSLAGLAIPEPISVAPPSVQETIFAAALANTVSLDAKPSDWKLRFDKHRRMNPSRDTEDWRNDVELSSLVEEYERLLRQRGMLDFDDLVLLGYKLSSIDWVQKCIHAKFPILVIDEYQDLGPSLHHIVQNLCVQGGVRLLAFGDADQSIYGFAGAKPELLHDLSTMDGFTTVHLKFNYRSGKEIIKASEVALGEKRGYEAKRNEPGLIFFHERENGLQDQAKFICKEVIPGILSRGIKRMLGDITVLYPSLAEGNVIAEAAHAAGYKFIRIDRGAAYSKTPLIRWLEDCAKWCSGGWQTGNPRVTELIRGWQYFHGLVQGERERNVLANNLVEFLCANRMPDENLGSWLKRFRIACLDRAFATEPTLLDEMDVCDKLSKSCYPAEALAGWTVATFGGQGGAPDHLNLITLHSAKGLEFDAVIMMGMDQDRIPTWYARQTLEGKKESRRLFYVGFTRARYEVHMTYSGWTENKYGRRFENGPSEFLLEVMRLTEGKMSA